MTGREIQVMLHKRGVTTWGLMHIVAGNRIALTVKKDQAQRAYALLQQHGVPVENPPPAQKPRSRKAARNAGGPFSVFDDVFGRR